MEPNRNSIGADGKLMPPATTAHINTFGWLNVVSIKLAETVIIINKDANNDVNANSNASGHNNKQTHQFPQISYTPRHQSASKDDGGEHYKYRIAY